ncbi:hypothetical protein NP493_743g00031 [Ridgeia piscesae]|uniref:Endonuclease-reverse transcriptase n=1 Tax=Ridgeia piscesae TaxID=27915 RepID=A0AAD9KQ04_RIDPI|nr:hypothetical protein NP493_743g00031 [Ridgeia piscesae]
MSNVDLYKKTGCNSAVLEIKRRRLKWLGHVLRMPQDSIPKVALRWTPAGKRKRGRPKMTWRQSVMAELKEMGLSCGEAQASAKDRTFWRSIVVALCPTGDEEDKYVSKLRNSGLVQSTASVPLPRYAAFIQYSQH